LHRPVCRSHRPHPADRAVPGDDRARRWGAVDGRGSRDVRGVGAAVRSRLRIGVSAVRLAPDASRLRESPHRDVRRDDRRVRYRHRHRLDCGRLDQRALRFRPRLWRRRRARAAVDSLLSLHGEAPMDYVRLGTTGLKVSRLCLGTMTYGTPAWRPWVLDEATSRPFIKRALEHGINFFDTANMYSRGVSEEVVGRALKDFAKRDEVVIATKVFYPVDDEQGQGLSRQQIMRAIDESLRRLGVDHVDLYQIHRFDDHTPIEETLEALHDVVKSGKARYLGASTMYAYQFVKMIYTQRANGWTEFVSMQNHYNLVYREEERDTIPFCIEEGIGVIPWSPLARGFLAGNRKRGEKTASLRDQHDTWGQTLYYTDPDYDVVDRVVQVAAQKGVKPIQVALAWILSKPGVTAPIVSATKLEQLDQLLDGMSVTLTADEIRALEEPYVPHRVIGIT